MKVRVAIAFLSAFALVAGIRLDAQIAVRMDGDEPSNRQILTNAGYEYTQESLVLALQDPNLQVAMLAANFLYRFPPTTSAVDALRLAAQSPNEGLAVIALGTLMNLKAADWQQTALVRLPEVRFGLAQVALAGVLAQGGRSEGWPVISAALQESNLVGVAAQNAVHFRGLKAVDGQVIDVVAALEGALNRHMNRISPVALETIDLALKQVRPGNKPR